MGRGGSSRSTLTDNLWLGGKENRPLRNISPGSSGGGGERCSFDSVGRKGKREGRREGKRD